MSFLKTDIQDHELHSVLMFKNHSEMRGHNEYSIRGQLMDFSTWPWRFMEQANTGSHIFLNDNINKATVNS